MTKKNHGREKLVQCLAKLPGFAFDNCAAFDNETGERVRMAMVNHVGKRDKATLAEYQDCLSAVFEAATRLARVVQQGVVRHDFWALVAQDVNWTRTVDVGDLYAVACYLIDGRCYHNKQGTPDVVGWGLWVSVVAFLTEINRLSVAHLFPSGRDGPEDKWEFEDSGSDSESSDEEEKDGAAAPRPSTTTTTTPAMATSSHNTTTADMDGDETMGDNSVVDNTTSTTTTTGTAMDIDDVQMTQDSPVLDVAASANAAGFNNLPFAFNNRAMGTENEDDDTDEADEEDEEKTDDEKEETDEEEDEEMDEKDEKDENKEEAAPAIGGHTFTLTMRPAPQASPPTVPTPALTPKGTPKGTPENESESRAKPDSKKEKKNEKEEKKKSKKSKKAKADPLVDPVLQPLQGLTVAPTSTDDDDDVDDDPGAAPAPAVPTSPTLVPNTISHVPMMVSLVPTRLTVVNPLSGYAGIGEKRRWDDEDDDDEKEQENLPPPFKRQQRKEQ